MYIRKYSQLTKNILIKLGIERPVRSLLHMLDDLINKNVFIKNKSIENIHKGKKCFLFCNGISVNDIEFSKLAGEFTFGCNFIHHHPDFNNLNLNYFVTTASYSTLAYSQSKSVFVESKIFSEENFKVWLDNSSELGTYSTEPNIYYKGIDKAINKDTSLFLGSGSKKFIEKNNIFIDKNIFYFKPARPVLSPKDLEINLSKRITFYNSGLFSMLAIAIYMGFKDIYLVGADYSFEPSREFHFYDSLSFSKNIEKNIIVKWINQISKARKIKLYDIKEDDDFYLPTFVTYRNNYDSYKVVNYFARSKSINITNIGPDEFNSPIYRKVSWDYVVKNVLSGN